MQLLRICGTATNAFLNLARASDLQVRRLLLLSPDGKTKPVVAEVMIDRRWGIVDPSYRTIMKDAASASVELALATAARWFATIAAMNFLGIRQRRLVSYGYGQTLFPADGPEAIMSWKRFTAFFCLFLSMAGVPAWGRQSHATIIYDDRASEVRSVNEEAGRLCITTDDLKRATGFELKPQGICRDELCFPVSKSRLQEFVHESAGKIWFNLVAFANLVQQPIARDESLSIWYFGLRADQRQVLSSLKAPDFTLPDMSGKIHSLSDFRGKKVLLVTWASW